MSRNFVRTSLTNNYLSPLRSPNIAMVAGSVKHDYCRFTVAFSRLAPERLPMMFDRSTGREADDEIKLARFVQRSFINEGLTDFEVSKADEYMEPWLVTFTVFLDTYKGVEAHEHRLKQSGIPWETWAALEWESKYK